MQLPHCTQHYKRHTVVAIKSDGKRIHIVTTSIQICVSIVQVEQYYS